MLSPLVTHPEIYIKLNRAMTLHADLKRLLDGFVAANLVHKHLAECILTLVATHGATMIRATANTLDPDLQSSAMWDSLGRGLENAHHLWINNTPPSSIAASPNATATGTSTGKRKSHPAPPNLPHNRGTLSLTIALPTDPPLRPGIPSNGSQASPGTTTASSISAVTRKSIPAKPQHNHNHNHPSPGGTKPLRPATSGPARLDILQLLGQTTQPYDLYPPYKADHRKGELIHAAAFMTHVKAANLTLKFVDHGREPRLNHIIADDPTLVGAYLNQTELDFPWLLEFSTNILAGEKLIKQHQAS